MPGNILVSVLEFMGLPSSSPSSSISLKVSMGKIEFQTWDKGDFSFPLTTLRDNLIVALLDADGKEISHAGVETTSIVEKGIWDDLFLLEGGGHVHMKLQFVLSEEERDRIRMMRASALKIKHDEPLNRSIRSSGTATMAGSTVASSLGFTHEVSDQYEEVSSAIPVPQGVDVHLTEGIQGELLEKNENDTAMSDSIPCNLEGDRAQNPQKQSQLGRTPSQVRKMISAFESGLAQDMRSSIKPPPTQSQSKELQHGPTFIRKRGEKINSLGALDGSKLSQDTGKLEELNTKKFQMKGTNSNLTDKFNVVHKEVDREEEKSHQDLMRLTTFETPAVSGRMLDEYSDEARRFCVTTGGKKVMDLIGGSSIKPQVQEGKLNLSMQENMEEHSVDAGNVIKVDKDEKNCHEIRKLKPESLEDIDTSGGPWGQAIKVAIMVGFGILVLLTRRK